MPKKDIILKFVKLNVIQLAFAINIIFNSEKNFHISDSAIILTIIIKKSQFFNINTKNKNKKKKNN